MLPALLPGAVPDGLLRLVASGAPADPLLRLAALCPGMAEAMAERLRMSAAERDRLLALSGPAPHPSMDDDALRRILADAPPGAVLGRAWLAGDGGSDWTALRDRLSHLPRPVFRLEGRDALALGVPPGPAVGLLLRAVRDWWMAGGCVADRAACRAELARLVAG